MKTSLFAVAAALALSACADYGYVYDYDAYGGPRGRYVGPLEPRPAPAVACARTIYRGPYDGGWRGPYYAGPFCAGPADPSGAP
jgi:hypothetical protein